MTNLNNVPNLEHQAVYSTYGLTYILYTNLEPKDIPLELGSQ